MVGCLEPSRRPSIGRVASLRPYPNRRNQVGPPNPAPRVNGQLPCAPLRMYDAFRAGSLIDFHEQSFFPHQKYVQWNAFLSFQATYYALHHTACKVRWLASHQVIPLAIPVNRLKSDNCSTSICVAIMTVKVKIPSQHRCDGAPNTIKVFPWLKGREMGSILIHSFPATKKRGHSL